MGKRIQSLSESPCTHCGKEEQCLIKATKSPILYNIIDIMYGDAEKDFHDCPIYISLTCPELVEVEE